MKKIECANIDVQNLELMWPEIVLKSFWIFEKMVSTLREEEIFQKLTCVFIWKSVPFEERMIYKLNVIYRDFESKHYNEFNDNKID